MEFIPKTEEAVEELSFREAILPPSLRELRQKLGQKAKQQKRFRFYSLYALVYRTDVLQAAWDAVRRNGGAPGVDGVSIEQITATPESEAAFLTEIERSLKEKTYRAQAVRRVYGGGPTISSWGIRVPLSLCPRRKKDEHADLVLMDLREPC